MDPSIKPIAYAYIIILALIACTANASSVGENAASKNVSMYFFWQIGCSHCEELKPFIAQLEEKYPQLDLKRVEVSKSKEGSYLFDEMAKAYGKNAKVTPTVFVGDYMIEGYNGWITEDRIDSALQNCTEKKCVSPQEKLDLYKSGATSTTVDPVSPTSSTTVASSTTTSSTSSTTTTIISSTSSTTTTTTTTMSTTIYIPPAEKKEDNAMLPGSLLVLAALIAYYIIRQLKKR